MIKIKRGYDFHQMFSETEPLGIPYKKNVESQCIAALRFFYKIKINSRHVVPTP